jgi:hypothetical protein
MTRELKKYLHGVSGYKRTGDAGWHWIAAQDNPKEYKYLYDLLSGEKVLNVRKEFKELVEGTLGYTILRWQDMYSPLGATAWDLRMSPYHLSIGACAPGSLCLTTGSLVGRTMSTYLDKCAEKEIEIRLKRPEVRVLGFEANIPANPNFYLVGPCFSQLKIWKEGNTVFVEPKICKNRPSEFKGLPNYCWATWGLVNYYVNMEAGSMLVDAITTAISFFFPPAEIIGEVIVLGMDVARETMTSYPYVDKWVQPEEVCPALPGAWVCESDGDCEQEYGERWKCNPGAVTALEDGCYTTCEEECKVRGYEEGYCEAADSEKVCSDDFNAGIGKHVGCQGWNEYCCCR